MSQPPAIVVIYDGDEPAKDVLRQFTPANRPRTIPLGQTAANDLGAASLLVIDIRLDDKASVETLKNHVLARSPGQQQIIIVLNSSEPGEVPDGVLPQRARKLARPLDGRRFPETVNFLLTAHKDWVPPAATAQRGRLAALAPEHGAALAAGDEALSSIFAFARGEEPLKPDVVKRHGETIVESMKGGGLTRWVSAVREHHDGTYQHCMLVTGVAIAFGQILRIPRPDLDRLAFAMLVHDVGKANVPTAILDKPGRLTDTEMSIMRQHPSLGAGLIANTPDIEQAVIDVVRHHHEYLDGTGYPDGLRGDQISDLIRIATIADIFGALVEKRAYKAPMSGLAAHEILVGMGPKLDQPLVRVMRAIARDF